MDKKTIITAIVSIIIGAGGIFALDATQDACDRLPERPAAVSTVTE